MPAICALPSTRRLNKLKYKNEHTSNREFDKNMAQGFLHRVAAWSAFATLALLAVSFASPAAWAQAASAPCPITPEQARFAFPLPHTARVLARAKPIKIVAL